MKRISLSRDIQMIPLMGSLKRDPISDEEYFSDKYKDYVSQSGLKNIDPSKGGSAKAYFEPVRKVSGSLALGSAVEL